MSRPAGDAPEVQGVVQPLAHRPGDLGGVLATGHSAVGDEGATAASPAGLDVPGLAQRLERLAQGGPADL